MRPTGSSETGHEMDALEVLLGKAESALAGSCAACPATTGPYSHFIEKNNNPMMPSQ